MNKVEIPTAQDFQKELYNLLDEVVDAIDGNDAASAAFGLLEAAVTVAHSQEVNSRNPISEQKMKELRAEFNRILRMAGYQPAIKN